MRTLIVSALLAFSALPAAAGTAKPAWPAYRAFGDWVVACDNTGACEARGGSDAAEALRVSLHREAGAGAAPTLAIGGLARRAPRALRFDGAALPLDPRDWRVDGDTLRTDRPRAVRAFVDAARRARAVDADGATGSLEGFNAALLFLDDAQGRVGTAEALIARGTRDGSAVPPPRRPPQVVARPWHGAQPDAEDTARYLGRLPAPLREGCTGAPGLEEMYALDEDEVLVLLPCELYAYQASALVLRGPRRAPERAAPVRLVLDPVKGEREAASAVLNAAFDPATATLHAYSKGRGLYDCGETHVWVYDGREFQLVAHARLDRCQGGEPGDFPLLWRADMVREAGR